MSECGVSYWISIRMRSAKAGDICVSGWHSRLQVGNGWPGNIHDGLGTDIVGDSHTVGSPVGVVMVSHLVIKANLVQRMSSDELL